MAGEPIDIEVRDKVADSIRTKLLNIATAALEGYSNVNKLQQALDQTAGSKLATAATQAASGQDKVTAAIGRTGAAARKAKSDFNAFGETEADVAKRLVAVATAAQQLEKASAAATKSQTTLAAATTSTAVAAQGSAKAYTAQMQALLNVQRQLPKGSPVSGVPSSAIKSIKDATNAMEGLGLGTVGAKRELLVLVHEFISGNFNRIPGSILVLGERMNGFGGIISTVTSVLTPFRIAMIAITLAVAAYEAIVTVAENSQRKFNDTLSLTQGISGLTYDSMNDLAKAVAANNAATIGSSKEVVTQLASSGRFQKEQIEQLADATIKLSKITGQSTDDIVKDFIRAADSPARYAEELQAKYKFVSGAVLNHIKDLDAQGQHAEATRVLSKSLYDYLQDHAPATLTGLSKLWNDLKVAISGATNALLSPLTVLQQIEAANSKIAAAQRGVKFGIGSQERVDKLIEERDLMVDQYQAAQQNAAAVSQGTANIETASNAMLKLADYGSKVRGNVYNMNKELEAFRKGLTDAAKDPRNVSDPKYIYALQNQLKIEQSIRDKYREKDPIATAEESRARFLEKTNAELIKQAAYYDDISDVRNALRKADEVDIQLASKKIHGRTPAALSDDERQQIVQATELAEANKRISQSIDSIYTNTDAIRLRNYGEASQAVTLLLEKGNITAAEAANAQRKLNYEYDAATDPLFAYNKALQDQTKLLEFDSREREAQNSLLQIQNQLLPQGKRLTDEQTKSILDQSRAMQYRNDLQRELDQLEAQNAGARLKIQTEQEAITKAFEKGTISIDEYKSRFVDLKVQMANLNLASGLGTFEDGVTASLGRIRAGFTNVAKGMSDSFGEFFSGVTSGFADSIGKAIVYGDSLGESLRAVAQGALSELISSLVKVGIQYLINGAIGATALATATAEQVAAASIVAAAWAPAAALASLASFGANSVPANVALVETSALAAALSQLKGFEAGGYTGDGGRKEIAGIVHGKEFVANAAATARNRGVLEAMNAGATVGSGGVSVVIEDHGTAKTYERVPSLGHEDVRMIARDVVANDAPRVIAGDLSQPNSRTSKALAASHNVTRKR